MWLLTLSNEYFTDSFLLTLCSQCKDLFYWCCNYWTVCWELTLRPSSSLTYFNIINVLMWWEHNKILWWRGRNLPIISRINLKTSEHFERLGLIHEIFLSLIGPKIMCRRSTQVSSIHFKWKSNASNCVFKAAIISIFILIAGQMDIFCSYWRTQRYFPDISLRRRWRPNQS